MKKRVTVTIDEDLAKEARKKIIDENTNMSALIEKFLRDYVDDTKNKSGL